MVLARYGVPNDCPFQVSCDCIGRFNRKDGLPVPLNLDENDVVQGCAFSTMFFLGGIKVQELEVDYSAEFPKFSWS